MMYSKGEHSESKFRLQSQLSKSKLQTDEEKSDKKIAKTKLVKIDKSKMTISISQENS